MATISLRIRSAAACLALIGASGCGGARVVHIPTAAAPTVAQSIQESAPSDAPSASDAPAGIPPSSASSPSESAGAPVAEAPSTSVIVDDYPEGEEEGPAEIVVVAPLQSEVEYRFDGNDPVPTAPSFDIGPVPEGDHTVEVRVIPPVGEPETFEFSWKQTKRYDPDVPVDDRELARRAKRRAERRAKRESKRDHERRDHSGRNSDDENRDHERKDDDRRDDSRGSKH